MDLPLKPSTPEPGCGRKGRLRNDLQEDCRLEYGG